ncbi:hypothetical protein N9N28_05385 [Rubripirellula amarantea]|uniref:Uncharacterized protein n=1 Tax=Rubripirellula amarantea TaxID=2527999 RepID=A0A5C5WUP3_9BACT|nr:hypothetical protein [Rubripirellula amarantea]MDA8744046.1 hypothetical protein [Rubripirellula amarantea]TWT54280.1 hypothetical protein Pla22_19220 [Rubripirellula amarantea]
MISKLCSDFLIAVASLLFIGTVANGQTTFSLSGPSNQSGNLQSANSASADSLAQAKASIQWLSEVAIRKSPRTFDGDKHWGETKSIWAGVKVRFDGGKLKTKRRKKDVNHGRWIKYEVSLPPQHLTDQISLTVDEVTGLQDAVGSAMRIRSTLITPMTFTARIQRWNLGVRIFSVTVSGRMKIRMRSTMALRTQADYSEIPPALVMRPHVETADLSLESFEVDRVSHVGGDAAEAWGEIMQEVLVERFVDRANDTLAEKLNKAIRKNEDDLRLSLTDWLSSLGARQQLTDQTDR